MFKEGGSLANVANLANHHKITIPIESCHNRKLSQETDYYRCDNNKKEGASKLKPPHNALTLRNVPPPSIYDVGESKGYNHGCYC
jgi:hypothetical protein